MSVGFLIRLHVIGPSYNGLRAAFAVLVLSLAEFSSYGADPHKDASAVEHNGESSGYTTSKLRWRETDSSLALTSGGEALWQYNYDTRLTKPYFHPIATTTGQVLTLNQPPDHVWHHGLWFSWKYINGVNYWEHNDKTGAPDGRTTWSNVQTVTRENYSSSITMALRYHAVAKPDVVLTEKRQIEISPPDDGNEYHIDWTSTFTALQDATLDRTPPRPKEPGGYAGLSIRFANRLTQRQAVTLKAPIEFDDGHRFRGRSGALDYNGVIDGASVGLAIFDSPTNPRQPTPWYAIRAPRMSYLNAAFLQDEPVSLPAGQQLTLCYRITVHGGRWNAAELRTAYQEFASTIVSDAIE